MRLSLIAVLAIVAILGITLLVSAQGTREKCLIRCEQYALRCAGDAEKAFQECVLDPANCAMNRNTDLRVCQTLYDTCRYECDSPPW